MLASGVIDQNIQPAEFAGGLFDQGFAEGLVAHISRNRDGLTSFGLNEGNHGLRIGFLFRQIVDRHIGALSGEGDRDRTANP